MKTLQKKEAKTRLTYACKRNNMLSSVMVKITYNGKVIECSNAAETIEVLKYIDCRRKEKTRASGQVSVGRSIRRCDLRDHRNEHHP
jgi:hypothetical protein